MKNTILPTSRKMAHTITRVTWRLFAVRLPKSQWFLPRRHRRSSRKSMRGVAVTGTSTCRSALEAHICLRSKRSTCDGRGHHADVSLPSPRLAENVAISLTRGDQALLFLNRRGYAPLTLCRACGFRLQCPNCDAWLVDHRFKRRLVCHHCGFSMPPPGGMLQLSCY